MKELFDLMLGPPRLASRGCEACATGRPPAIVDGGHVRCVACDARVSPLHARLVDVAGQPTRVSGSLLHVAARIMGVVSALFGLAMGALVGVLASSVIGGIAVGAPLAAIGLTLAWLIASAARKLEGRGDRVSTSARDEAIQALARRDKGRLYATDVAAALRTTPAQADAWLTAIAKRHDGAATVEIDDDGQVFYAFPRFETASRASRFRVGATSEAPPTSTSRPRSWRHAPGHFDHDEAERERQAELEAAGEASVDRRRRVRS